MDVVPRVPRSLPEALPEDRHRRILESITEFAVVASDLQGMVTYWGTGAERLFGYAPGEMLGRSSARLFTPEDLVRDLPRREMESVLRQGRAADHNWLMRRDGSVFWADGLAMPLRDADGQVVGFVKVVRDATSSRRRSEELEAANRRLQDFVNAAAHELATPMTPIRMQVDLLREARGPQERTDRQLAILARNIDRMAMLLRDILDAARLGTAEFRLDLDDVDLAPLLRQSVEAFHDQATQGGVTLEAHAPPGIAVHADPRRVSQVLANLVSNALKFTPSGGRVELRVRPGDGQAVVEVADTGAGIAPGDLEKLFQPFHQVGAGAQGGKGTGLGLHICKGLVERHGGRVWASSDGLGKGTIVSFSLPLSRRPGPPPA
jgi:PAS domain S-box-containing protein